MECELILRNNLINKFKYLSDKDKIKMFDYELLMLISVIKNLRDSLLNYNHDYDYELVLNNYINLIEIKNNLLLFINKLENNYK